jgi:hypothetical protein
MQIEPQPTEVAAQIVYLAQPRGGHFVAQTWAQMTLIVK